MRRAVVLLAALATLAVPVTLTAAANGHTSEQLMLPDLRQAPVGCPGGYAGDPSRCADWDVCLTRDDQDRSPAGPDCVDSGSIKTARLRFTTSEENVGDGPALLYGHRDGTDQVTMSVRQAFQVGEHGPIPDSYATAQRGVDQAMYYDAVHEHWHLLHFAQMELKTLTGETVVKDRKNGFCLGDRYTTADAGGLFHNVRQDRSPEGRLAEQLGSNQYCKYRDSLATDVKEGISVGRGDNYSYNIAFQWLDVTHVPSGTYIVVNTVNSGHTLLETNYNNNSSSIVILLQWPGGAHDPPAVITAPPVVKLIKSCPGSEQCAVD
ncbi:MAG: lysyl oxidase [Pseudonocardiales bacterium]|nr:lysyl oxidase [Pseudonocardiales bacterium]